MRKVTPNKKGQSAAAKAAPSTKRRPGSVQTVSNNTSALTLGDLERARAARIANGSRCYDSLVSEIATLECVYATLSEWDLAGQPTGTGCRVGSAELVLLGTIERLHILVGTVESMESRTDEVRS